MSTGGAAMNAMMNTEVAVRSVGIIITPNQPTYRRFSVLVTHSAKRAHRLLLSRLFKIAVIILFIFFSLIIVFKKTYQSPQSYLFAYYNYIVFFFSRQLINQYAFKIQNG